MVSFGGGGAEVQLSLLAKEMAKEKNLEISFVVADFGQADREIIENVTVFRSFKFSDCLFKRIVSLLSVMRRINADCYLQRAITPVSWLLAVFSRLNGNKFIYMLAHDDEVSRWNLINLLTFRFSTVCICQNDYQKAQLQKLYHLESPKLLSSYEIKPKPTKSSHGPILWVGRSVSWKRPELFIKLAEENPDMNFILICAEDRDAVYHKQIQESAKKTSNIEYHDYVPFSEIEIYFQEASIYVNTSQKEGFPNTFVQAAKCATPILSLNVDPNSFIEERGAGIFCNDKFDRLRSGLRALANDEHKYKLRSDSAYTYAKENHDIKNNSRQLLRYIK